MRRQRVTLRALALMAVIALVLVACGGSGSDTTTSAGDTTTTAGDTTTTAGDTTTSEATETTMAAADLQMAWYAIVPHPFFSAVEAGVDEFSAEYGIPVEKQYGTDLEMATMSQNVEALVAQGYTLVSAYPIDVTGSESLYEEITAQGAIVVNYGASTPEPTAAALSFATDVKAAAMDATEMLIEAMGGQGKIINVLEALEDPNTILRKEGIEEVVAQYPDVEIIQEVGGVTTNEEAVELVTNAFAANASEVDGMIATGLTTTVGIATVLDDYYSGGGDRTVYAVGYDQDPQDPVVVEAIENDVLTGTIAQNSTGQGYLSMVALMLMGQGWTPADGVYHIEPGFIRVTKDSLPTFQEDMKALTAGVAEQLETTYLVAP